MCNLYSITTPQFAPFIKTGFAERAWTTWPPLNRTVEAAIAALIEPSDYWPRPIIGLKALGDCGMATIMRVLARKFPATPVEAEILWQVGMFCTAGLLVSLVLMSYGLDLSAGFF